MKFLTFLKERDIDDNPLLCITFVLFTFDVEHEKIARELDVEKTQLLGGDLENTHFVKGLDRALLKKVREQLYTEQKDNAPSSPPAVSSSLPPGMSSSSGNIPPQHMMTQEQNPRKPTKS